MSIHLKQGYKSLFSFLILNLFILTGMGQVQKVVDFAGGDDILNGVGVAAHFSSPWQILVKDSVAYLSDKEGGAVRRISLKTKRVTTLFKDQPFVAGMALSRTGDSLFFSSNDTILKVYRISNQSITILDTLKEGALDAMICLKNGNLLLAGNDGQRILMRTPAGQYSTLAGKYRVSGVADGIDTAARFYNIAGFALSQTEDTLYISDRFNSKIRRLRRTTRTVSSLAVASGIYGQRHMALNKRKDTMYVANFSNHTIIRVALKTGQNTSFCGLTNTPGYVDGQGIQSRFYYPNGIAQSDSGYLVADWVNQRIRLVTHLGKVKTFAGIGKIGDGIGINSKFSWPTDIIKHPLKDTIYVSEQFNHVIRSVSLKTTVVKSVAGDGTAGNVPGIGSAAKLNRPTGMAISTTGDSLYFVEPFGNRIKLLLTQTGEVKWLAGSDTAGYVDKPNGKFSRFNRPSDIALKGNLLYVADAINHKIRTVNIATSQVKTYAGSTSGFKDTTLLQARFNRPVTLEWVENRLFVGEDGGLRIRVIDPVAETVQNWAGNGSLNNSDGLGSAARFRGISRISYNPLNRLLYVGGNTNEGFLRTVGVDIPEVKTLTEVYGYINGLLTSAKFAGPSGVCLDTARKQMLVGDVSNNRIRAIRYFPNTAPKAKIDTSLTFLEDAGLVIRNGFATNMNPGTATGDTLQKVSFAFAQPMDSRIASGELDTLGNLKIQSALDSNGHFYFRIKVKDNGGTAFRGVDSLILTTHIHITPVNDPPIFTILGNDTALHTIPRIKEGFVASVAPGPFDERNQTTIFSITVDKPEHFLVQPYIENNSILRFTPKPDSLGPVQAQIRCSDNGGTENGGINTSDNQNFTIFIWDPLMVRELKANRLVFYPNPASNWLNVVNLPSGTTGIRWTNSLGQLVFESKMQEGQTTIQVPASLKGVYFLQTTGSQYRMGKIIIH